MAKRFTDTTKWDCQWFRRLSFKMRLAWIYLNDKCDHAGFWTIDMDALNFFVGGDQIALFDLMPTFEERLLLVDEQTLYLTHFVEFQYGPLNQQSRVHASVLQKLAKYDLNSISNPMHRVKDKEKDKAKVKAKEKAKEEAKEMDKDGGCRGGDESQKSLFEKAFESEIPERLKKYIPVFVEKYPTTEEFKAVINESLSMAYSLLRRDYPHSYQEMQGSSDEWRTLLTNCLIGHAKALP